MNMRINIKRINAFALKKMLVGLTSVILFYFLSIAHVNAEEPAIDMSEDFVSANFFAMDFMFEADTDAHFHRRVRSLLASNNHSYALLQRMAVYMPIIEAELDSRGLPAHLKYLTITESSVNPVARSRAGAVGLWQIMLGTARHLGLRVNRLVDERRDPVASTNAALDYLEFLYEKYGDWKLALAAYNAGPGRVDQAVRRANSKDFDQVKRFLPLETRNYIPSFMASVYFGNFHKMHGFKAEVDDYDLVLTDVIKIYDQISFTEIAKISGVEIAIIRKLNPMFQSSYIPSSIQGYNLILPRRGVAQMESKMKWFESDSESTEHQRVFEEYIEALYLVEDEMSWGKLAEILYLNPYQLSYLNPSVSITGPVIGDQIKYVVPRFSGFFIKAVDNEESHFLPIKSVNILPLAEFHKVERKGAVLICSSNVNIWCRDQGQISPILGERKKLESPVSRGKSQNDIYRLKVLKEQMNRLGGSVFAGE